MTARRSDGATARRRTRGPATGPRRTHGQGGARRRRGARIFPGLAYLCVLLGLAGAAVSIPRSAIVEARPATIRPPALEPGDTVALVAPAGRVNMQRVREARANLTRLGYRVKTLRSLSVREGYLAGSDAQRAIELDRAFADPEVKMILCIRGGFGTPRILNRINYRAIREHPKILVGFSDITALLNAVTQTTGLITFHGPMAEKDFAGKYGLAPFSSKHLWTLVKGPHERGRALLADWGREAPSRLGRRRTIAPGTAEGRLAGGNLSTVAALMGTPFEIDARGAILFLEDVNEEPFRIDRMLCQLKLAGKLNEVEGVLLGGFTRCVPRGGTPSFTVDEVLDSYFAGLGVPVLAGFPAGHLTEQVTLPIGCRVRLDATRKVLEIVEPAVKEGDAE